MDNTRRYTEVLRVCLPLVMSMSATTVMEFTDRLFLANYSVDAISAVAPAGLTAYLFIAFLGGVANYLTVFIAQYHGKGQLDKIGASLWQGIYFTFFSGFIFLLLAALAAKPIFGLAGHPQHIQALEVTYFTILCRGAILHVAMTCFSTFFTGQGKTRPVMIFHILGMTLNIPLDYGLIYGAWGLPELGLTGAALATVASWGFICILLAAFLFIPENIRRFSLFSQYRIDRKLFMRLLRFGVPGPLQFTLDILAFTIFLLLVGRIGTLELAATNIVLSISALAFMPSMGVSQGLSALVGQALGAGSPERAKQYTKSSIKLLMIYIVAIDILFIFAPEEVLSLFISGNVHGEGTEQIMGAATSILQVVSLYLVFDSLYMTLAGALKGAGDTRFVMWGTGGCAILLMILPLYIGIEYLGFSVTQAWVCVLTFVVALFLLMLWRYRNGKWQHMLVIEEVPPLE